MKPWKVEVIAWAAKTAMSTITGAAMPFVCTPYLATAQLSVGWALPYLRGAFAVLLVVMWFSLVMALKEMRRSARK